MFEAVGYTSEGIAWKAEPTADGGLEVSGYAAIFHVPDAEGEALEPTDDLQNILDVAVKAGTPIFYQHDERAGVLGRLIEATVKPAGIWIKARLTNPAGGKLAEVFEAVKSGTLRGLSFRGPILKSIGRVGPTRIRLTRLLEVSVAPRPVQRLAQLEAVAAKAMREPAWSPPQIWSPAEIAAVEDRVEWLPV